MRYNDQRLYTVELEGATERQLLLSLAIAAFRLAPRLADDGSDHPEFHPSDDLSLAGAADLVKGSHVISLFAKGRAPMTHIEIVGRSGPTVTLRLAMFDGDAEQLFSIASDVMDEKFAGFAGDTDDFELHIELDPSFNRLAA